MALLLAERPVHVLEEREALGHRLGELLLDLLDALHHALDIDLVELERVRCLIEESEVVHDDPGLLVLVADTVGAADGLEQRVVAHWLVQVHRLQDRRVEAREQLGRDHQELERVGRLPKPVEEILLRVAVPLVLPILRLVLVVGPHRDHHVTHGR